LIRQDDDVPDEWADDDHDQGQDDPEAEHWAAINKARAERYQRTRKVIGHDGNPWDIANLSDRRLAERLAAYCAVKPSATIGRTCADLGITPSALYSARWLAVAGGLMRQVRGKWQVVELKGATI